MDFAYTFSPNPQFNLAKGVWILTIAAMTIPGDAPAELTTLQAARAGDLAAFDALMRQYERLVLVTALRLTGSMADAQDISQDVFLKLYRNLSKVESGRLDLDTIDFDLSELIDKASELLALRANEKDSQ